MNLGPQSRPIRIAVLPVLTVVMLACESSSTIVGVDTVAANLTIMLDGPGVDPTGANVQGLSMSVGETTSLAAVATDALGLPVGGVAATWSSSDYGVASVSAAGVVTAIAAGTADIYATADAAAARLPVVVTAPDSIPPPAPAG